LLFSPGVGVSFLQFSSGRRHLINVIARAEFFFACQLRNVLVET